MADLYTASGVTSLFNPVGICGATGINNATQVVGGGTPIDAFVWDPTHGLRNLNDPTQFTIVNGAGWNLIWAEAINDHGQIVGWGTNPSGEQRIFLLTPQ